ncbi:MAG: TolC family outer membrane protein [Gammaproteobacteria bacterium]|nr:TolC family outer membrane protein [Gammaproteobacteria bacterium]
MNHDCQPVVHAALGEATRAGAARRLRRASLPVLLALLSLVPLHASAADLLSLFQLAAERDPVFKGAQAGLRATLEAFPQARAGLLPSVGIAANVARNFQQVTEVTAPAGVDGVDGFGEGGDFTFTSGGYSLNVTQPLYHRDRFIQLKQADSRIRQAQYEVDAVYQELIVRLSERYFALLGAADNLDFAGAELTALRRQLEETRQRFEVGLIAITDVEEAQAGYDLSVAQEIEARNLVDDAREALHEVIGQEPGAIAELREQIPLLSPEPADIAAWADQALVQNLRVAAAGAAVDTAREEIDRQAAGHFPTLDLVGSHGFDTTGGRFGNVETDGTSIGVQLAVPIFSGGAVVSRTHEAAERHQQAIERREQARRESYRRTRVAFLGVVAGISRIKALKQAVQSSIVSVASTKAGLEVGTRTAVDVVVTERALFGARRDYARARYNYLLDTLRLKFAAGTLTTGDLAAVNGFLER